MTGPTSVFASATFDGPPGSVAGSLPVMDSVAQRLERHVNAEPSATSWRLVPVDSFRLRVSQ